MESKGPSSVRPGLQLERCLCWMLHRPEREAGVAPRRKGCRRRRERNRRGSQRGWGSETSGKGREGAKGDQGRRKGEATAGRERAEGRDAAGTAGAREGERERSLGRPKPRRPRGRGEAQARPGPGSQRRGATRREAGGPRGSHPRPGRTGRPKRDAGAPPRHVHALTSSQLGRSGNPVPSVQIVCPRSRRLTDPDPNPRRGQPAPPESHCACVTQPRAPPPAHAPPTPVTRQRGRRWLRRRGARALPLKSPVPAPLGSTCVYVISCYSPSLVLGSPWVCSGPAFGACPLPLCQVSE